MHYLFTEYTPWHKNITNTISKILSIDNEELEKIPEMISKIEREIQIEIILHNIAQELQFEIETGFKYKIS